MIIAILPKKNGLKHTFEAVDIYYIKQLNLSCKLSHYLYK